MAEDTVSLSLSSLLAKQSRLIKQAARAIPHSFNKCIYDEPGGYIRQAIYLCKTCTGPDGTMGKGICAACSVSCHADHEQLELFPKRAFRCDCPTSSIPTQCQLHQTVEPPNDENVYGQNYAGRFCRCGRDYDAETETETMVQCLACEDWLHESCLYLRAPPPKTTPKSSPMKSRAGMTLSSEPSSEPDYATEEEDDEEEEDDSLLIPTYDSLICGECVAAMPFLRKWAGSKGVRMIVKKTGRTVTPQSSPSKTTDYGGCELIGEDVREEGPSNSETRKRSPSPSSTEPAAKKLRMEDSTSSAVAACRIPEENMIARKAFEALDREKKLEANNNTLVVEDEETGQLYETAGDLFLSDGWRERWCRCDNCLPQFQKYPWLLEEEETYSPPEDPDSKMSLEELGLRALSSLPRDKALDSIRAFNEMRDNLLNYLRPFAQEGKVVSEQDVAAFFEALKEGKAPAALG